jgi:FkbM family methyltransferase
MRAILPRQAFSALSSQKLTQRGKGMASQVKQLLRPLAPYLPRVPTAPSWQRSLKILNRYGFSPATVFDIGVGFGTHALYHAYPHAFYYLVDPTSESLGHMRQIARHLNAEILNLALGDRDGEVVIEIRSDIQGSTLFEECGPCEILRTESVPLRRFDTVIGEFERPALCKIDVQGAEMLVLNGMSRRMQAIDAFILETSTIATVKNGPEIDEVVRFMKENGFVIFDIVGMKRRPLDGATAQLDMMFVPEESFFRSDRRWSGSD